MAHTIGPDLFSRFAPSPPVPPAKQQLRRPSVVQLTDPVRGQARPGPRAKPTIPSPFIPLRPAMAAQLLHVHAGMSIVIRADSGPPVPLRSMTSSRLR
jgi:hypothetical protein